MQYKTVVHCKSS